MQPWHRYFGLLLTDLLQRQLRLPVEVQLEPDMSLKQQFLDVLVVRQESTPLDALLPDGLTLSTRYSLLSYKSHQEPLNSWTVQELIGHYVSYRKQVSYEWARQEQCRFVLRPESDFQLYAVSTRYPVALEQQSGLKLVPTDRAGVYTFNWGYAHLRVIVTAEIELIPKNAFWLIFSHRTERVKFGFVHSALQGSQVSTIVNQLFQYYRQEENIEMPYTLDDFIRDEMPSIMASFSVEARLQGLSVEDRLKGLAAEERLKGLAAEDRLKGLPEEELQRLLALLSERVRH